ncbi:hypothetical protein Pyn_13869 [Prunus yedoensis var. nudiflora]|uniref:Uncharacterized protein n=1 Tax=Prunus yedoensis var. nudiflora TaxID=2094558 RepID=A0A314UXW2_PRUYE|nr:hypothetical protein Pyn_13869 [Prunus yedoensis var. nudiflora]
MKASYWSLKDGGVEPFGGMECTGETVRGLEASNLASTDEGYLGGCEVLSHDARAMDSGKMSTKQSRSQSKQYNGLNWKQLRK